VSIAGMWKSYVGTVEVSWQEEGSIRALDGEEEEPCLNQWEGQPNSTHFTLKTERAASSETSVTIQKTTWCNSTEDHNTRLFQES
jgi:hypothetical protein